MVKRQDVSKLDFDAAFFAELEGQAVGLVAIEIHDDEAYIKRLVVLENFRRKGIGAKLIEKAIEFSKSKGTKRIRVKAAQNTSRFYERNGFRPIGYRHVIRLPHMNDTRVIEEGDVEWMKKRDLNFETVTKVEVMIRELQSELFPQTQTKIPLTVSNIKELSKLYRWRKIGGDLMGSERVTVSLPEELNKRLERYIEKHYRAYITGRGLKAEIIEEALKEWLDKRGG